MCMEQKLYTHVAFLRFDQVTVVFLFPPQITSGDWRCCDAKKKKRKMKRKT